MNETSNNFEFEICANSVESCLAAQEGGADRVELCAGIPEGGTTPSHGDIVTARRLLNTTKLHVIIRPRGGDFTYSDLEMDIMAADIDACREAGVDGVVFGCLTPEGDIDLDKNAKLMAHVGQMAATFHRAFDRCRNPLDALGQLEQLGFNRVLTSGQQKTAEKGYTNCTNGQAKTSLSWPDVALTNATSSRYTWRQTLPSSTFLHANRCSRHANTWAETCEWAEKTPMRPIEKLPPHAVLDTQ